MKHLLLLVLLLSCSQHPPQGPNTRYSRAEWKHWTDTDKNCLNTRQEILKARSQAPVRMNKKGCTVVSGKWEDYYYPETHTLARAVDIDHLVPLKLAFDQGGHAWSAEKKEKFANDPENLVITNRSYNRKKEAKSIDQWLPVHRQYTCRYLKDWKHIKMKYGLKINHSEQATIHQSGCLIP